MRMSTSTALRVAAAISAVFTAGHSMGGLRDWSPIGENDVLRRMADVHFQAMGVRRSYLDFYLGFGWSISVAMVLQTVLLWQLASLARADVASIRPMIAALVIANIASAAIAWRFIFPFAALFALVLLIPLAWAYLAAR